MKYVLGMDIGSAFIKYGVFTPKTLKMIFSDSVRTAENLPEFVIQVLYIAHEKIRPHKLAAVGIGVPAFISKQENHLELAPNIRYLRDIQLQKEIRARTYLPLAIENDANLAAVGEYYSLSKPRPNSFVHLTLGTGVGAGIILNGKQWTGEHGFAGEFGHVTVDPDGRPCGCGSRGCLETECSEKGIIQTYRDLTGSSEPITAEIIHKKMKKGDEVAAKAFNRAGYYLGILFSVIANVINPKVISVGGGVAAAGDALLKPAVEEFRRRIHKKNFHFTHIHMATKGNQAGILGAAHLARSLLS